VTPPKTPWRRWLLGGPDSLRRIIVTGAIAGVTIAFVAAVVALLVSGGGALDDAPTPTAAGGFETFPAPVDTEPPLETPVPTEAEPATPTEPEVAEPTETLPPAEPTETPVLEAPSPTAPPEP
jgi:hypothetical protein